MGLTVFVGAVFGLLIFPLIAVLFLTDDKPPGHRVRRHLVPSFSFFNDLS